MTDPIFVSALPIGTLIITYNTLHVVTHRTPKRTYIKEVEGASTLHVSGPLPCIGAFPHGGPDGKYLENLRRIHRDRENEIIVLGTTDISLAKTIMAVLKQRRDALAEEIARLSLSIRRLNEGFYAQAVEAAG